MNCSSVMFAAAATRLRTLTWLVPPKTTPLAFMIITVPAPLIWPWISLGRAFGSLTRFSAAQLDCCWKSTVVLRPTLKVSQLRIALSAVCSMLTVVLPPAWDWVGALALIQPWVRLLSTCKPPLPRPSGIVDTCPNAACRPAACAACWAAIAATLVFSVLMDRARRWLTCACWLSVGMPGTCPALKRAAVVARVAPFSANHAALNAWAAWALPATINKAMAWASGLRRNTVWARGPWAFSLSVGLQRTIGNLPSLLAPRGKTGARMRVRRLARGGTELLSCKVHIRLLTQKNQQRHRPLLIGVAGR